MLKGMILVINSPKLSELHFLKFNYKIRDSCTLHLPPKVYGVQMKCYKCTI